VVREVVVSVVWHSANSPRMTGQARAELALEDLENFFALTKRPQQNRNSADVQRVCSQPEQMRSNSIQLSKNRANVMSPRRNGESHHLFDGLNPDQPVGNGGDVIKPIPVRGDHRVHAILGNLFHAAMQVADVAIEVDNSLAVELED